MGVPCTSVCTPWATTADVDQCEPCETYDQDLSLLEDMLAVASDALFHLSGHQFAGTCQDTVRPCGCSAGGGPAYWSRDRACGCRSGRACGCTTVHEISLGVFPLTSIVSVIVDGAALGADRYRIDDNRWLVRLPDADGSNPGWPHCQRMDLDTTEDETFAVTFTYGMPPPVGGVRAAASLACQLSLACQPDTVDRCRLPQRVRSITRAGVSMDMAVVLDPLELFREGRTGLVEVDLWLASVNPHGVRRRATVHSPDVFRGVRRAGT